jgi:glycosyltransferase involved in cell wall biosynthesis
MITVRHTHKGYPEQRNIIVEHELLRHQQEYDLFKTLVHLSFKLRKKTPVNFLNSHYNPFTISSKNTIRHFFNGISYNTLPWVTTFETALPRYSSPNWTKQGIKRLASPSCKKIIALSSCAYNIQLNYLSQNFPTYYEAIKKKMIVLHPPQKLITDNIASKPKLDKENPKLIFTFVGNEFFRKGGREVLNVFKKICVQHPNIKLNIISNFSPDSYASATTKQDVEQLKNEFPELPANIHILGSIKNEQVLQILCNSHVALLPTYADTYGYFVLEAQACGCPVISTDIRALPEINNNECGWMIKVPKDDSGNGKLRTNSERRFFSSIIERELFSIINEIVVDPSIISKKGQNAIGRIKSDHDPNAFSKQLKLIYEKSLMS